MLSEQYCRDLEQSVYAKQKQIKKLRNDKFLMQLLVVVGWSLFVVSQFRYLL
jgi:hypothetical protein